MQLHEMWERELLPVWNSTPGKWAEAVQKLFNTGKIRYFGIMHK